ncbi:MAG: hypothetical protein AAFN43_08210 [Pseudomonadota bacterium]
MTNKNQPNQIDYNAGQRRSDKPFNAIEGNDSEVLRRLAKKRHLAGLMCPPMAAMPVPSAFGRDNRD